MLLTFSPRKSKQKVQGCPDRSAPLAGPRTSNPHCWTYPALNSVDYLNLNYRYGFLKKFKSFCVLRSTTEGAVSCYPVPIATSAWSYRGIRRCTTLYTFSLQLFAFYIFNCSFLILHSLKSQYGVLKKFYPSRWIENTIMRDCMRSSTLEYLRFSSRLCRLPRPLLILISGEKIKEGK